MTVSRKVLTRLCIAAVTVSMGVTAGLGYAGATTRTTTAPGDPRHYMVQVGISSMHSAGLLMFPDVLNINVGDSVTFWTPKHTIEPHTVTFGPKAKLDQMAQAFGSPVPQKHGPPIFEVSKEAGNATDASHYTGGFANSGLLWPSQGTRKSWTVTFDAPGKFAYHCLVHYPFMKGLVIVHGPAQTTMVQAGYAGRSGESFYFLPQTVTVHAGQTVTWTAFFHTVTFASAHDLGYLRHHFALRAQGKPYAYQINPKIAFPSSRNGCGTSPGKACSYTGGFLNSGIIIGPQGKPGTFSVKFAKPGWYHYGCLVHTRMNGTVHVIA